MRLRRLQSIPVVGLILFLASGEVLAADAVVAADAYLSQANPANNFGSLGAINVGPGNAGLIQFDLSSLPAGLTASGIQKATMTVYVNRALVAGGLDFALTNQNWSETATTFSNFNQGIISAPFASGVPVTANGTYLAIDVTQQVKDWVTGTVINNGIIIRPAVSNPATTAVLDSKESTTTSQPARLDIVLSSSGATGPTGPTGPSGPSGAAGVAGPAGPTGATGVAGPAGATGPSGAAGLAGPAGPTGASGPLGPAGATGPSGPAGVAGPTGASGPLGPAGATGPSGPAGVAGPTGASGPLGPAGATGPSGAAGMAGPAGATGATGPSGPAGSFGTGASPTAIPLAISGHIGTATWHNPASSTGQVSLTPLATVVTPTACKPSMTITSYAGVSLTWNLISVIPSTASSTWTPGSNVITCATGPSGGSTCSATAGSNLAAGTILTLTTSTQTAPGGGGLFIAFGCQ